MGHELEETDCMGSTSGRAGVLVGGPMGCVSDETLDSQIREGWERWCELIEEVVSSQGMLPSPEVAMGLAAFLSGDYWSGKAARVEAPRRALTGDGVSGVGRGGAGRPPRSEPPRAAGSPGGSGR